MTTFNELLKRTSIQFYEKIKKSCTPLYDYFSISHFSYVKITSSGHFTCLTSRPDWIEHYFGENFQLIQPHFRHPSDYKSGIGLPGLIQDQQYQNAMQVAQSKFQIHPGILLTQKTDNYVEFTSFEVKQSNPILNELLINEIPLLKKFTQKFRQENKYLFNLLDEDQIDLADIMGNNFQFNKDPFVTTRLSKNMCLKELGLGLDRNVNLSSREIEVLHLLLLGASANFVAEELFLSKRTVEHYIEKLKDKLLCYSKMELISKARELEQLGYLGVQQ